MSISFLAFIIILLGFAIASFIIKNKLKPGDTYGDASFGEWTEKSNQDFKKLPPGLVLGKTIDNSYAVWSKEGHWLTVAPTGAGKSTGVFIPSIKNWQDNLMAIDIKGELLRSCAQRLIEQNITPVRIDPFGIADDLSEVKKLNIDPFAFINHSEDRISAIHKLANILIDPPTDKDVHWAESARVVLTGIIAACLNTHLNVHVGMQGLVTLINRGYDKISGLKKKNWDADIDAVILKTVNTLNQSGTNERGAILSTIRRQIDFLYNQNIMNSLSGNDNLAQVITAKNKYAIFVILPADQLTSQARYLRLITGLVIESILTAGISRERRYLLAIDEASAIGHLEIIEKGLALFRGYGASFLLSFQDLNQLHATYGKANATSIMSNSNNIFWSMQELSTCEYISNMLGNTTVLAKTRDIIKIPGSKSGESRVSEAKKALLSPDQIRTLPKEEMICFIANQKPIKLKLIKYNEVL